MSAPLLSPFLAVSGLEYAFAQSIFPGKIILWMLIALSLFSWMVVLSKVFFFYRSRAADAEFTRMLRGSRHPMQLYERNYSDDHSLKSIIYDKGAREVAFQMLGSPDRDATFGARLRSCDGLAPHQMDAVREAFRRGEEAASARLRKGLPFLAAAATGAPFLGLFGMVWILMKTFSQTAGEGAGLAEVAPGVSGALAVMVIALLVATPAIFAQIVLSTANREKIRLAGDFRAEAVRLMERFYTRARPAAGRSLPEDSPAAHIAAAAAAAAIEAKRKEETSRATARQPAPPRQEEIYEPDETLEEPDEVEPAPAPEALEEIPEPIRRPAAAAPAPETVLSASASPAPAALDEPEEEEEFYEEEEEAAPPLPEYEEKPQVMAGPVYANPGGEMTAQRPIAQRSAEQLELRPLRPRNREKPADTEYDTPFAEPELSPIAQQTAVLMARRRGPGSAD